MQRNLHKDIVRGLIAHRSDTKLDIITYDTLISDLHCFWQTLGADPIQMSIDFDVVRYMDNVANDYEYVFRYDGKDDAGNKKNPRLVHKDFLEIKA